MMRRLIIVAMCLTPMAAYGQQATPQAQALLDKLNSEYGAGLSCNTQRITSERDAALAQAEVKRLKDKYEPEKPSDKTQ